MSAKRCSLHGINYPTDYTFNVCPICKEPTSYISNAEPQEDWADRVAAEQEREVVEAAEPPGVPQVENVRVRLRGGQYFVHYWDLYAAGLRDKLRPTDLIQVGAQTFEILEWIHEFREFMVRPFSTTLTEEDLMRLVHGLDRPRPHVD